VSFASRAPANCQRIGHRLHRCVRVRKRLAELFACVPDLAVEPLQVAERKRGPERVRRGIASAHEDFRDGLSKRGRHSVSPTIWDIFASRVPKPRPIVQNLQPLTVLPCFREVIEDRKAFTRHWTTTGSYGDQMFQSRSARPALFSVRSSKGKRRRKTPQCVINSPGSAVARAGKPSTPDTLRRLPGRPSRSARLTTAWRPNGATGFRSRAWSTREARSRTRSSCAGRPTNRAPFRRAAASISRCSTVSRAGR
jgi:hypothetical protein